MRPYLIKIDYEKVLKQYDSVIATGNKILKIYPNSAWTIHRVGECYELIGQADTAMKYYGQALFLYSEKLSKMDRHDFGYKPEMINKALALIMLRKQQEGRAIFKKLADASSDEEEWHVYQVYFDTSRDELIKQLNP